MSLSCRRLYRPLTLRVIVWQRVRSAGHPTCTLPSIPSGRVGKCCLELASGWSLTCWWQQDFGSVDGGLDRGRGRLRGRSLPGSPPFCSASGTPLPCTFTCCQGLIQGSHIGK